MLNFNYCNPTRILFGRDEHKKLGEALKKENIGKVLSLRWRQRFEKRNRFCCPGLFGRSRH